VDLNQQAALLVEYQRSYQANAEMVSVLNQLLQSTINMLAPGA
jgi:flagellar hook-associated protein FlgK